MKSRKWQIAALLLGVLAAVLTFTYEPAQATNPAVTIQKMSANRSHTQVYRYVFSTAIANADTVLLGSDDEATAGGSAVELNDATPFYIGYLATYDVPDSGITIIWNTTETTADSARMDFELQISAKDSPSWTTVNDDWITYVTVDGDSAVSGVYNFKPHLTGVPYMFRIKAKETDTNKDATQTWTVDVIFPKYRAR